MSPETTTPTPEATAAPVADAQPSLRDALAARFATRAPAPEDAPPAAPDAVLTDDGNEADEEPAEPSAPDSPDGETPEADPFAGMSRKQRGEALRAAKAELEREQEARQAAETRAKQLEQLHGEADTILASLEGTDEQLADLRRKARAGDYQAREQADIYEANREMLGPVRVAMRKQEAARAWTTIGDDFRQMARHLPESDRAAFLASENVVAGGDLFAARLKASVEKPLKDEIKALKAEVAGLKAANGSRGVGLAAGGRSANGAPNPNATTTELMAHGLRERMAAAAR